MIEIKVKETGRILDLNPDLEFELEIENPFLSIGELGSPYTQNLKFPLTYNNREIFDYVDAFCFIPRKTTLSVIITINAIYSMRGILVFDSIEEGVLNYTFTGRDDSSDIFDRKIYELNIYECDYDSLIAEKPEGIIAPVLVNSTEVGKTVYSTFETHGYNTPPEKTTHDIKFHNWPVKSVSRFTPAVSILNILQATELNLNISTDIRDLFSHIAILSDYPYTFIPTKLHRYPQVAKGLPDMTVREFIENLCKLFSLGFHYKAGEYIFKSSYDYIDSPDYIDYSNKVSDVYSVNIEPASSYIYGTKSEEGSNPDNIKYRRALDNNEILRKNSFAEILSDYNGEYKAYLHTPSTVIISGKEFFSDMLSDIIVREFDENISFSKEDNSKQQKVDVVSEFIVPKCIPVVCHWTSIYDDNDLGWHLDIIRETSFRMSPIVSNQKIGDDRKKTGYIGLISKRQMSDTGFIFNEDYAELDRDMTFDRVPPVDENLGFLNNNPKAAEERIVVNNKSVSLQNKSLLAFHQRYKSWVEKDKKIVKSNLRLDTQDMINLNSFCKVMIYNQLYFIKKLTYTFIASSDTFECKAEFISV